MTDVELRQVSKSFQNLKVVHDIDLDIDKGEFVVLVGPSGCGKSTTLRMVAGLERPSGGEIHIGGKLVNNVQARDRDIAMVFQSYALYPQMTVAQNMAFGLRIRKVAEAEVTQRIARVADILDLSELLQRKPHQLSGGQRQRVAMGRAMVRQPKVFLFDEPLSNLDAKLRVKMRAEIKKLHQMVATTTVYVTHDQVEAMTLADRVVVMNKGRIVQIGPPNDLYHEPASRFVAGFIGSPGMNFFKCRLEARGDGLVVALGDGTALGVPASRTARYAVHAGRELEFGLRPEHITEQRERPDTVDIKVPVEVVEPMGMETLLHVLIAGAETTARIDPAATPKPGETVMLSLDMGHMHLLDPESGKVL
ncbi:sn-glycerol-3-phosphate ABC transporter ATP-binding protein UgpC [Mesorhizobium sp. B2-4-6]|uniref:ABC transporter ATP-binding protein n=1 Tax=Mesorhizobium sp. B2-4-6 TaxID=2589943 RepID=UPI0011267A2E|nr:sn-glycerol-3-phosphate ABC transporter ATP-binding protein UgpC [Mesorhizobium sp. B2-4-6]TPL54051.1 sn-glycerol-3-phosphate ABC transporter ATP-binding protein UgpC [Mesorhizobium sp. B2-4-6]